MAKGQGGGRAATIMRRLMAAVTAAAALAGCAPTLQTVGRPGAAFAGPRLEAHAFVSFDGARLGLTRWEAADGHPWAVIVGVHGMNDYANAFHLAARWWAEQGIATLAYDQRGFGRSPGRGIWAPDELRSEDLRTLVQLARAAHPGAVVAVVGESLGGAVAIDAFASERPPAADRLVLLAPAVWGWSRQPLAYRAALWLAARVAPGGGVTPPGWLVRNVAATDNRAEAFEMSYDPLMSYGVRFDALYALVSTMEVAWRRIGEVRAPLLFLYGARDQVIPRQAANSAAARLKPDDRTACYLAGHHLLLRDLQALNVWRDVAAYLRDPGAPLPSGAPPMPCPKPRRARSKARR